MKRVYKQRNNKHDIGPNAKYRNPEAIISSCFPECDL